MYQHKVTVLKRWREKQYGCDMWVRFVRQRLSHLPYRVKRRWGENLMCQLQWEMSNLHDSYAVIVVKGEHSVGHLSPKISCFSPSSSECNSITATVTWRRNHSLDLRQENRLAAAVFQFSSCLPICARCLAVGWPCNPRTCVFVLASHSQPTRPLSLLDELQVGVHRQKMGHWGQEGIRRHRIEETKLWHTIVKHVCRACQSE